MRRCRVPSSTGQAVASSAEEATVNSISLASSDQLNSKSNILRSKRMPLHRPGTYRYSKVGIGESG